MSKIDKQLAVWIAGLDEQVGDTEEEIKRRRESNSDAVELRRQLKVLQDFLRVNTVPNDVRVAIEKCLNWNPHANKGL